MDFAVKIITVLGLGIIELWAAIPMGTALNLQPLLNGFVSGLGAILGVLIVIGVGERLRNFLLKKKGKSPERTGRIYRLWDKYGIIGLGLLSPLITGAPLGTAIGLSLGAQPRQLFFWMSIGIMIWTVLLTTVSTSGFTFFRQLKLAL